MLPGRGTAAVPLPFEAKKKFLFLSESDAQSLLRALRDFERHFVHSLAFAGSMEVLSAFVSQPTTSVDLSRSIFSCIRSARDFAAYPFVDSVCRTLVKPTFKSFGHSIPWTMATSLGTATTLRTVDVLSRNWDVRRRLSLAGWRAGAAEQLAARVGFQTALGAARNWIPPDGDLAREYIAMAAASLGEAVATAPMLIAREGRTVMGVVQQYWESLPMVLFGTTLFRALAGVPGLIP
jgi:hypothetical protein